MAERSRDAMDTLRGDPAIAWVVDHLSETFSEGVSHSAKEDLPSTRTDFMQAAGELTPRERTKREKYETSRPYTEQEKLALIEFALEQVFVAVPAMESATWNSLKELGSNVERVEFSLPDEEDRIQATEHIREVAPDPERAIDLKYRFEAFRETLRK
jgi:hypothetical protein